MPVPESPWTPRPCRAKSRSPLWRRPRTPPVTCGGVALAMELRALARQLRAAWRARRARSRSRAGKKCRAAARAEGREDEEDDDDDGDDDDEDEPVERRDGGANLEGDDMPNAWFGSALLAERRGSYPLIDARIVKGSDQQGESDSAGRRKLKTLLSFQRFCHASRLLGEMLPRPPESLHLLDYDYLGQAAHMLSKVGSWDFDVFLFDRLTNGNGLVTLMCHLFNIYGLVQHLQLDMVKLHRFLSMVRSDYHSQNPYHNAVHAADVTQAMYCFLQEAELAERMSPLDVFLGLMAAAAHDVDHPGVNQPFLIKTQHHLASLYQNMSVLESHHWRSTVGMLRESRLLSHLPDDVSQGLERQLGSLILATDISRQDEFLLSLRARLDERDLDLRSSSHRHFILQIGLKCADVCNSCRAWPLSKQWSHRVCQEFFRQGDLERHFNLEISPLCDQRAHSVPAIQTGFISYIVEPLFAEWRRFTGPSALNGAMTAHLRRNKARWSRLLHQGQTRPPEPREDVP